MNALKEAPIKRSESKQSDQIVQGLQVFLASIYTLYVKTQNFHWNVTGEQFHSLHEMFEGQYQQLLLEIDETAERIRTIGYFVPAALGSFQDLSKIEDENKTPLAANQMVQELEKDHATIIEFGEKLASALEEADDAATNDFVIDCVKRHQKMAWMLKSSL